MIRLRSDFATWTPTIRQAWRDLVIPGLAVHYFVVKPEPPISEEDIHVAHLILTQSPRHFERAVVLSAIYQSTTQVVLQHVARFTPAQLGLMDAIELVEVPDSVRHRRISGSHGWRPLRDPPHPLLDISDGVSLRVTIHPPEDPTVGPALDALWDDVSSRDRSRSPRGRAADVDDTVLLAHFGRPRPLPEPVIANPNVARDPYAPPDHPVVPSDTDSSPTASTYDSEEESQFFHIFQLEAEMIAARIQTNNWAMMFSNIRNVLQLRRHQVQQLYIVTHLPQDLKQSSTQVALVQHHDDLVVGDTRQFVLLDIAFHGHQRHDFRLHRFLKLIPEQVTRQGLLSLLGLATYCDLPAVRRRCLVRRNHRRIHLQDHSLQVFSHADYLRIDLPPISGSDLPTLYVARGLRDGHSLESIRQRFPTDQSIDLPWESVWVADETDCSIEADDDANLLQLPATAERLTAGSVAHDQRPADRPRVLNLEQAIPRPSAVSVDFSTVQWAESALRSMHLPIDSPTSSRARTSGDHR